MELTGIAIFYFVCVAFGFLFALITVILGELGAHMGDHVVEVGHDVGADVGGHGAGLAQVGDHGVEAGQVADVSHPEVYLPPAHAMPQASVLNMLTILVFVAFFGLAGLFAVWVLKMSPLSSLAFALPVGLISAVGEFVLYVKVFIKAQGTSEATMQEILGWEGEVITSIPGDRVGEIAYVIKGTRYNSPAVSADGQDLPRGTKVRIVNVKDRVLVVRRL